MTGFLIEKDGSAASADSDRLAHRAKPVSRLLGLGTELAVVAAMAVLFRRRGWI